MSTLLPNQPEPPEPEHKTTLQRSIELQRAQAAKAKKTSKKTTTTKSE